MKNLSVAGLLGASLFLGCFATPAIAKQTTGSMIQSLDMSVQALSFEEIKKAIQEHSKRSGAYLSLGESHLEEVSTHGIQKLLATEYLAHAELGPVKLCSEKIDSFLNADEGQWLQSQVQATAVYLGNSPGRTDFTQCPNENFNRFITYSGFFHQDQFAKPFPQIFPQTSVITDYGNNIKDQMENLSGFFISQVEFPVFEMFETTRVFKYFNKTQAAFETEAKNLISKSDALRASMTKIYNDPSPYLQKRGVFIDQRFFKASGASVLPAKNAYLLVTDLEYRKARPSFYFLNKVLAMPDADRARFVKMLSTWKIYFTEADSVRAADGSVSHTTFGLLPQVYEGESAQLALQKGSDFVFFTLSGDDPALTCIVTEEGQEATAVQSSCSEALQKFVP